MSDEQAPNADAGRLDQGVGRMEPKRTNACKLTECQGKPRCRQCLAMDSAYARPQAMTEGELWSWVRSVMSQGADIRLDYDHGTHKTYEHYSARLDAAAAERAQELWARIETPNAN